MFHNDFQLGLGCGGNGGLNMGAALNRLQTKADQAHKQSDAIALFTPSILVAGKVNLDDTQKAYVQMCVNM